MGILDELKQQADQQKQLRQQQALSEQQLAQQYEQLILPKMQKIYAFFKEILEYLRILETPVTIEQYSRHFPQFGSLIQTAYKLKTDKHGGATHFNNIREIYLRFTLQPAKLTTSGNVGHFEVVAKNQAEIDSLKRFLNNNNLSYEWKRHFNQIDNASATFQIEKKIPVRIHFLVDYEKGLILLEIRNQHDFNHIKRKYTPEEIDDAFLDELAKFLLNKENNFIQPELTQEQRQQLREKLRQQQSYPWHSEPIAPSDTDNQNKDGKGLLDKLSSIFKA